MSTLSFAETRDLWLRMLRGWSERLNPGGCGWPGTDYAYEGATRMFWSLAAWLSHPQRPRAPELDGAALPVGLLVLRALRNGPDPAHPDHWPLTANPDDPFDQIIVEAPMAGLAACLLDKSSAPWTDLVAADLDRINAFLAAMPAREYDNNWNLFVALNHVTRQHLRQAGFAEFGGGDDSVIDAALARTAKLHLGGGWFTDNAGLRVVDDYNALVLQPYPMLIHFLQPERHDIAALLRDLPDALASQPFFFDAGGAHPEFGRSSSYKFGRLLGLVQAYALDQSGRSRERCFPADRIPVGQLRRLIRLHLNHYLGNGTVDPVTFRLRHGQTPDSDPEVMENYLQRSPTSVYWAMNVFGALWMLADDDPLWSAPEEPLPAEQGPFVRAFGIPGFILHHAPALGHVELINARNAKPLLTPYQQSQYPNKYNKFAYSSRLGWTTRSGSALDQCLLLNDSPRGAAMDGDVRAGETPGTALARCVETLDGRRVSTLIFLRDGTQLRAHRVTGPAGFRLREGSYALGRDCGETPLMRAGTDWQYLESSRGSVFLRRLAGYGSLLRLHGDGHHSRDPAWSLAFAEIEEAESTPFHAAVFSSSSRSPQNPDALAAFIVSCTIDATGLRVLYKDGFEFHAEFPG